MSPKHKQLASLWRTLLVIAVSFLAAAALAVVNPSSEAVHATEPNQLCVPPYNHDTRRPSGWLNISFVNRAAIQVSYSGSGNCDSPSGANARYVFANDEFKNLLDGYLIDSNTGDGNFDYRFVSGDDTSDESRVKGFSGRLDDELNDTFNGKDKKITRSDLQGLISDIDYIIGFEEDRTSAECDGLTNGNFLLYGNPLEWRCGHSIPSGATGYKVGAIIGGLDKFNITYGVVGAGEETLIQHVSQGEQGTRTFSWCAGRNQFRTENCNGNLYITSTPTEVASIGSGTRDLQIRKEGSSNVLAVTVAGSENTDGVSTTQAGENITGGGDEEIDECSSNGGGLSWILCPVAELLDNIVAFLDEQIRDLLFIKSSYFDQAPEENGDPSAGQKLKASWTQIRNIAYAILVPIMLVMVIGTALGFEIFSAYTIKKALPRMVIAVIFITLSWYICLFLVEITNVIGVGIRGLITGPFDVGTQGAPLRAALVNAQVLQAGDGASVGDQARVAGLGVIAAAGLFVSIASVGVIMSTLFSAALVLGGIFLLLIARQIILLALFLVAPLAILAWIFPGNDAMWKTWWKTFSRLLLLFPVIMLLLGVGEVFANVAGLAATNSVVKVVLVIGAFIMPFFFIPFMFKWVGGVFGNIAGMVNDSERGVLDRLKKGRQESRAKRWNEFKTGTGTGFGQRNMITRGAGTRLGAGVGGGKGVFGMGKKGKARMDQMARLNSMEQIMKNPAWNGVNQDDNALHAGILLQDMNAKEARAALIADGVNATEADRSIAAWQATGLGGRAAAIAAAQQLVSTGTGYRDVGHMSRTLARASGGNLSTASALAGFANAETKKVGRGDLAPGFGNLQSLVHEELSPTQRPTSLAYDRATVQASRAQDPVTLLRGKTPEVRNLASSLGSHLTEQHRRSQDQTLSQTDRDNATDEMLRTAAQIEQLNQSKSYASDDNQEVINELMNSTDLIRTGGLRPGAAGPSDPTSVRGRIERDPQIAQRWERLNPRARNPNDPNLPE